MLCGPGFPEVSDCAPRSSICQIHESLLTVLLPRIPDFFEGSFFRWRSPQTGGRYCALRSGPTLMHLSTVA
eukprot:7376728-Pyramimonas_sp.AAC.1